MPNYPCGRFAPSPSGPLHFGSLVTAVGSFLDARHHNAIWKLRIEDLDTPRVRPGATEEIIKTLEAFGLYWDGEIVYQSVRKAFYREALQRLQHRELTYLCACSRREIADSIIDRPGAAAYSGKCRNGLAVGQEPRSIRVRTDNEVIQFNDRLQGPIYQAIEREVGDFVLCHLTDQFAYQLAVVVDDHAMQVTQVVRGYDLLESTPRQIYLQRLLNMPTPTYMHLPVAVNSLGEKLSKQTLALPIFSYQPVATLIQVLQFLNQAVPNELSDASLEELWQWAVANWNPHTIAGIKTKLAPAS